MKVKPIVFGKYCEEMSGIVMDVKQLENDEIRLDIPIVNPSLIERFRYLSRFKSGTVVATITSAFLLAYVVIAWVSCYLGSFTCIALSLSQIAFLAALSLYLHLGSKTSWDGAQRFRLNAMLLSRRYTNPQEILEEQIAVYRHYRSLTLNYVIMPLLTTSMAAFLLQDFWNGLVKQLSLSSAWQASEFGVIALLLTVSLLFLWFVVVVCPLFWMQRTLEELKRQ